MPDRLDRIEAALDQLAATDHRIQERHEALAQTVELLTSDVQQDAANIRDLAAIAATALDAIKRLERIATAHEQRLDQLEGQ